MKTTRRVLALGGILAVLSVPASAEEAPLPINARILELIEGMPYKGDYNAKTPGAVALRASITLNEGRLVVNSDLARPSFCSGATYHVFLKTILAPDMDPNLADELLVKKGQTDGIGVWGRWNANGPGTACLFHELKIGENFTDFKAARPGDFMKIWWNDEIGHKEHGHSVIFLGMVEGDTIDGEQSVDFWSSNIPGGYYKKSVRRSQIKRAVFSRLTHPERLKAGILSRKSEYLASLLEEPSTFGQVAEKCGVQTRPAL